MEENDPMEAGDGAEAAAPASGDGAAMPTSEDANPCSPASSSSSDSDDEATADLRIETLERALTQQPLDYESHVQYIQCLRKSGHVEKLRKAREDMNKLFPLSAKMWQEWINDEISLSEGVEYFTEIEKLYECGLQEYLSVTLWCDYINYVQEHDPSVSQCSQAGISKMREIFERALTAAGLHIVEGSKIWEAYREFEQAVFLTISDGNSEDKAKEVQRIRALFHRQLSVPLVDLRSALIDYKVWESEQGNSNDINSDLDGVPSNVASAYQKAIDMYNARKQYEDQLTKLDASETDKLQQFVNYIKFEESCGDPARVQILYERAISEFPVSTDLWLGYTSYLDRTLKVPMILKSVYCRATRNCSWVSGLWVRYLLSLERVHASEEEMRHVFEQSVQCAFPSINEYLDLFLTRVDGLRRRISFVGAEDNGLDFQLIRQTFTDAVDALSSKLNTNDLLHLHAYWARLEANLGEDMVSARGVWENLIKRSGSVLDVWQQYIAMEINMNQINQARSIYKRCYSKRFPGTGSEDICNSWLRFEREYGTLEDYDLVVKKVTPRLQELMIFKAQQEPKSEVAQPITKDLHKSTRSSPQKRKPGQLANKRQPSAKRKKENMPEAAETSDNGPKGTLGTPSDTMSVEKGEAAPIKAGAGDVSIKHADKNTESMVADKNTESMDSKTNFYTDQCTAFVSNLNFEATEEHLRDFFSDCGRVTAIRLLRDKFTGKSRGLAYVDFLNDEHLKEAIRKNKMKLLGKKVSIARSDPKQSNKRSHADNSSLGSHDRGAQFRSGHGGKALANEGAVKDRPGGDVRLTGKNTFAVPRAVAKPLGWSRRESKADEAAAELKSNEEFRNLLLKK